MVRLTTLRTQGVELEAASGAGVSLPELSELAPSLAWGATSSRRRGTGPVLDPAFGAGASKVKEQRSLSEECGLQLLSLTSAMRRGPGSPWMSSCEAGACLRRHLVFGGRRHDLAFFSMYSRVTGPLKAQQESWSWPTETQKLEGRGAP